MIMLRRNEDAEQLCDNIMETVKMLQALHANIWNILAGDENAATKDCEVKESAGITSEAEKTAKLLARKMEITENP